MVLVVLSNAVSENVGAQCLGISTSAEFAKVAENVCPNINVQYSDKEMFETQKPKWDNIWRSQWARY